MLDKTRARRQAIYRVRCHACSRLLDMEGVLGGISPDLTFVVAPCLTCLEKAEEAGYDKGHAMGRDAERVGE